MRLRLGFLSLVAAIALTASGCGGSADSSDGAKAVTGEAATGDTVHGTGYTFAAPEGWHKPTRKVPGFDPDALVIDTTDKDGFSDNLNVLRADPAPVSGADDLEKVSKRELEGIHASQITTLDRLVVDGETAVHLTSVNSQNGVRYHTDQFAMIHDKVEYVITFSRSTTVSKDDEEALAQSVLAGWKWAS